MAEIEILWSCVDVLIQTSKCKDLEVENILISSVLSLHGAKAQTKLCPIISLHLRFSPNKMWPHTNEKGALLDQELFDSSDSKGQNEWTQKQITQSR